MTIFAAFGLAVFVSILGAVYLALISKMNKLERDEHEDNDSWGQW